MGIIKLKISLTVNLVQFYCKNRNRKIIYIWGLLEKYLTLGQEKKQTYLECWKPNHPQSSLLGTSYTSPSGAGCHFWKHSKKASFGMVLRLAIIAIIISSLVWNRFPFNGLLNLGNSQKSQRAILGGGAMGW